MYGKRSVKRSYDIKLIYLLKKEYMLFKLEPRNFLVRYFHCTQDSCI